jgi:MAPEG family protein
MRREQKIVAIGAASGVAGMALSVWALTQVLPAPGIETMAERLSYALRINVVALIPFFVMLISIGNSRFLSDAIDPTLRAETPRQQIDGRVADNTLQQNFVFAVASLALSTLVDASHLQVLWSCAIVFMAARLLFWFGYRLHPLLRAPGMSATAYLNLGMILYVLYASLFAR